MGMDAIMIDLIMQPFQYEFIQRALAGAIVIGILCAALGVFVVLRRMSLIGHALTHSALPGLVIAYLLGGSLFVGALMATLMTGIGIGAFSREQKVYEDTSVGIVPTVMFAFGILLISATKSYRDMSAMLFGNILGMTNADLCLTLIVTAGILVMMFLFFKELKLFCVDSQYAQAIGIPVSFVRYGLLIALSLTVVVGIQAVGTILTSALLVIPAAAARLLTDRLRPMLILACVFAVIAAIAGVYASYYLSVSSGACIVLVCAFFFGSAWVYKTVCSRRQSA